MLHEGLKVKALLQSNWSGSRIDSANGMRGDVDPDEVSAAELDDDEGIEQVETESWNNEQVHGGNVGGVVTQ
jgi:hypothetical protein